MSLRLTYLLVLISTSAKDLQEVLRNAAGLTLSMIYDAALAEDSVSSSSTGLHETKNGCLPALLLEG